MTTYKIMDGTLCHEKGIGSLSDALAEAERAIEKEGEWTVVDEQTGATVAKITNATEVERLRQ